MGSIIRFKSEGFSVKIDDIEDESFCLHIQEKNVSKNWQILFASERITQSISNTTRDFMHKICPGVRKPFEDVRIRRINKLAALLTQPGGAQACYEKLHLGNHCYQDVMKLLRDQS